MSEPTLSEETATLTVCIHLSELWAVFIKLDYWLRWWYAVELAASFERVHLHWEIHSWNTLIKSQKYNKANLTLSRHKGPFFTSCVSSRGNLIGPIHPSVCLSVNALTARPSEPGFQPWDIITRMVFYAKILTRTVDSTTREGHQHSGGFINLCFCSSPLHYDTGKKWIACEVDPLYGQFIVIG